MRVNVAAVGTEGDEVIGVLQAQMPSPRGAHRHAAQYDTVAVYRVVATDGLNGLKDVGFPGPAVSVFDPTQWVELQILSLRDIRPRAVGLVEPAHEPEFAHPQWPAAAVKHDVQAHGPAGAVVLRHNDAVGLHRAVH
jgi:hypothetical protein